MFVNSLGTNIETFVGRRFDNQLFVLVRYSREDTDFEELFQAR